jgi:hypothetical protein
MRLPIQRLCSEGHEVVFAVRDLTAAQGVLKGVDVRLLQAPVARGPTHERLQSERTYAHLLRDNGFGSVDELCCLTEAWQSLLDWVKPDVVLGDHSPVAMLAARRTVARRAVIGPGFFYPPDVSPMPAFHPDTDGSLAEWQHDEDVMLATINRVLDRSRCAPLSRVSEIHSSSDACLLSTYRELDPYPSRGDARYFGVWPIPEGSPPEWPNLPGLKIFAYLKPIQTLRPLLDTLRRLRHPTLVLMGSVSRSIRSEFECRSLRFADSRCNLEQVVEQADIGILNATHGTTAAFLMAGKPTLQLPMFMEQILNAEAVERQGAGLRVRNLDHAHEIVLGLVQLISEIGRFRAGAQSVAERYSVASRLGRLEEMLTCIRGLMGE